MAKSTTKRAWGATVPNRDEQFEMKRQVVLRTAARTYSQRGFYETTLADIADELHISKPTLYYYFKNKDEILFECHRLGIDAVINTNPPMPGPGEANGRERLIAFLNRYVRMVVDDFGTCLVMTGPNALEPENRGSVVAGRREIDTMLRNILTDGMADGSLEVSDPKLTAMFIFGAMNWMPRWYQADGPMPIEQLADRLVEFALNAIGRTPSQTAKTPV